MFYSGMIIKNTTMVTSVNIAPEKKEIKSISLRLISFY